MRTGDHMINSYLTKLTYKPSYLQIGFHQLISITNLHFKRFAISWLPPNLQTYLDQCPKLTRISKYNTRFSVNNFTVKVIFTGQF